MAVYGLILFTLIQGVISSSIKVSMLKMLNGREMPAIALGTSPSYDKNGVIKPKYKEIRNITLKAIDMGYRHFDTAAVYETEEDLGEAIRMKIDEGVVKRENIFFTTKLWNTAHKQEKVFPAFMDSLNKTGLDYIDLFLMHWPIALNEDNSLSDVDYMETWRAMEEIQKSGKVKSIGLANFNKEQLKRVISEGNIKPVALQIEVHPQIIQKELLELCKSEGIIVQGYSPLGSLVMRYGLEFPGPKFDDPILMLLAQKYGKTTAQIVLRWAIERNVVPLPKSFNPERLAENLNVFDFKLEPKEVEEINKYDSNKRYTLPSFWQENANYPFEKVENPIADPFKS